MTCLAAEHSRQSRPVLELADVFRHCGNYPSTLNGRLTRVVKAILNCRTSALGGHVQQCNRCDHREISYNSCRNRHCPKCQGSQQFRWLEAQQKHLLPIEYHHVVFTIPDSLHSLFRLNPRRCYGMLFAAVAETLHDVARNPKRLGATIGFSCVLHTWTQKLLFHPHIHCIVTGGGLDLDRRHWVATRRGFLFPVPILSCLFRARLLRKLELALDNGDIRSNDKYPHLQLHKAACNNWVVYSKAPFAGPQQVLRYLGRYTHRVAIGNHRLVALDDKGVTFRWNDRANGEPNQRMTLEVKEFARRFLLHVLPSGLMRIRHYGLLSNSQRRKHLARCRRLIGGRKRQQANQEKERMSTSPSRFRSTPAGTFVLCPRCKSGHLVNTGVWNDRRTRPP